MSRILHCHNVPWLRVCGRIAWEVIGSSEHTAATYERECSGEPVHMDVKTLGRVRMAGHG